MSSCNCTNAPKLASLVTFLKDFARVVDFSSPTQIRNVNHSVNAFVKLHERAVGRHVPNCPLDPAANGEFLLDLVPRIRFELSQAQRNLLLFLVYAEHDRVNLLADG